MTSIAKKSFLEITDALVRAPDQEAKLEILKDVLPHGYTSEQLLQLELPEPRWVVPGIIPEGFTILAGCPKVGKSWFALNLAIALSVGGRVFGKIKIKKTTVLYLALEDTPRRLQIRLNILDALPSSDLHLRTEWSRGKKGVQALCHWKEAYPKTGLIIIDTLQRLRTPTNGSNQSYGSDYDEIAFIKKASDELEIPIIAMHHTRKMPATDFIHEILGTSGISGAADTDMIMKRSRRQADAELLVSGRDVEEQALALKFVDNVGWSIMGDAAEHRQTDQRQVILEVIRNAGEPITAKEVAEATGKNSSTVRTLMTKMLDEGFIYKAGYGKYAYKEA